MTPAARAKCWHMRDSSDESHETRGQPSNRDTSEIVGLMLTGPRITVLDASAHSTCSCSKPDCHPPQLEREKTRPKKPEVVQGPAWQVTSSAAYLMHTTEARMIRGTLEYQQCSAH